MNGSCQCGNINYIVSAQPLLTYACHCRSCQKRTGSAFSMGMFLTADALSLEGELSQWARVSERGIGNTRFSCSQCGNIIYGIGSDMPELVKLQPGTLDGDEAIHAEAHLWTRSAQSWFRLPPHAPQFATQPGDADELLKAVATYRQWLAAEAAGKSPADQ